MDANEILNKIQNVATDEEAMIVEQLAIRAGFWWKCKCYGVSCVDETHCCCCGRPRAAEGSDEEG